MRFRSSTNHKESYEQLQEDSCVCNGVQHCCKIGPTPPSFRTQRKRKRRWRWKSRTLHFLVRGERGNSRLGLKHNFFKNF